MLSIGRTGQQINKWTFLPPDPTSTELFRLIALFCCGSTYAKSLPFNIESLIEDSTTRLRIGALAARHAPYDRTPHGTVIAGSVIAIEYQAGQKKNITNTWSDALLPKGTAQFRVALGTGNHALFSLAYGSVLQGHNGSDDFEFNDPNFRTTRYASIFGPDGLLTDPAHFLQRLHYRAVRCGRFPAKQTLLRICGLLAEYLDIDTGAWQERGWDAHRTWQTLSSQQQQVALPALDAARHMMDAFVRSGKPLQMPGVMMIDRPDNYCEAARLPGWIVMMDKLFPGMQFFISLPGKVIAKLPMTLLEQQLYIPEFETKVNARKKHRRTIKHGSVLLVDVDSRLPNLALMKLSHHLKSKGQKVVLTRKDELFRDAQTVYASCVFSNALSNRRIDRLRKYYGDSLVIGGSGVDLQQRLAPEIEQGETDYTLYPELGDRAIGFLTRGCPYRCPFCLVPEKEGDVRVVDNLDSLLQGRNKLILLDDNILAHQQAGDLLEEMVRRDVAINFTQTLDIRLLDNEMAGLLKRIRSSNIRFTRRVYHFSLNCVSGFSRIRENYARLGFKSSDNIEFVYMYGFDTTLREDVERFRFIESLPGAYVFVQEYQPVLNGPLPPSIDFFGEQTDHVIDQLLQINFTQNMKSMEKYYRWLSKRYAQRYGRLHQRLVDTIFRYNKRDQRGRYIATLAHTTRLSL